MELEFASLCPYGPATSPCPEPKQTIPLTPNSEVVCYNVTVCKVSEVRATGVKIRWILLKNLIIARCLKRGETLQQEVWHF